MAIQSMTGFGRAEKRVGDDTAPAGVIITVEMKSVNHRFLDISCKLPAAYQRAEPELQRLVRAQLRRGRVDVFVSRAETGQSGIAPSLNEDVFRAAIAAIEQGFHIAGVSNESLTKLEAARQAFSVRGVLESAHRDPDIDLEIPNLLEAGAKALDALKAMRAEEGRQLRLELEDQLSRLETIVTGVAGLADKAPAQFHDRLKERIGRLLTGSECEPQRLAQEVAMLVDRADVTEELARLRSHVHQFRQTLAGDEGGKKLEFLLQEMGREVNTTGSKSQVIEMTQAVVEGKLILERLREQVLNVE